MNRTKTNETEQLRTKNNLSNTHSRTQTQNDKRIKYVHCACAAIIILLQSNMENKVFRMISSFNAYKQ